MSCSKDQPDKVILVVHGVGDPDPGNTISLFARSLATEDCPLQERQEVIWLTEKSENDHVQTFPAHQRKIRSRDQTLELCEAFWGDLSRVRRGWVGVIQGIFQIVFGLRYVAYVAADQPGRGAYWLKRLGLISSKILHGPVLAVTFFLSILMVAVCGTEMLWPDSYKTNVWPLVVLSGCAMIALCISQIVSRITRSRVVSRFCFWLDVTTMFVTGLMLLKYFFLDQSFPVLAQVSPRHPGMLWHCRVLVVLLGLLWFVEIQVLLGMVICWFISLLHPRAYRPALHVAFLIPALAVGIWGQVVPLVWVSAKEGLGVLAKLPEFASVFDDALPFLGVQLMMLAVILAASSVLMVRYFLWRKNANVERFERGSRAPRLIINNSLQLVFAFCTAVGVFLVGSLCILQILGYAYTDYAIGRMLAEVNKYAVSVVVPMGGLMLLLIPHLRPAFDIVLDVVNHFYFRPTDMDDALVDDDEFDISETTFENGKLFFSRRDALHLRIKRILAHYRDQYDHQPELVIVSHSQGTMVAIEVLNDEEVCWVNNCFKSVSLITMGSPFSHLYQHYFGHYYPALDQPFWSSLRRRIDRWTNVCRIDDFVGTDVSFPLSKSPAWESSAPNDLPNDAASRFQRPTKITEMVQSEIVYSNLAVGARGHLSYWSDCEVLDLLREALFEDDSKSLQRRAA
ncbi:MAG: hypothetical protein P8J27_13365 [Mariniblastus sp.]|nr:hypothetical protein [Mariniblastus sp.]